MERLRKKAEYVEKLEATPALLPESPSNQMCVYACREFSIFGQGSNFASWSRSPAMNKRYSQN